MTSAGDIDLTTNHTWREKPFLILSDVHLGAVPHETEHALRTFLDYVAESAAGLLINGDLFDVWFASRHFVVRHHVRVLAKLADLVERGIPVYFVGGNHDALEYGGAMLRDDLGLTLLEEPAHLTLGAHRTLVVHGDGIRRGQSNYRKRHPVLRSRTFRWLAERLVPLDRIYEGVARWSETVEFVARHRRGESTGPKPVAPLIEAWARAALRASSDVDVVLAGHSHVPALVEVETDRYYMNTGDWIEHMTYGVLPSDGGQPEVRCWPLRNVLLPDPNRDGAFNHER